MRENLHDEAQELRGQVAAAKDMVVAAYLDPFADWLRL